MSLVSTYSQTMANTDTTGMDASIPPSNVLRLATSAITTISITVMDIFNR